MSDFTNVFLYIAPCGCYHRRLVANSRKTCQKLAEEYVAFYDRKCSCIVVPPVAVNETIASR